MPPRDLVTEAEEDRHVSALYRPRSLASLLLVAFAVSLAAGVWVTFPAVLLPAPLTVPVLLGLSLVLALIAAPAVIPWRVVVGPDRVQAYYLAWTTSNRFGPSSPRCLARSSSSQWPA